MLRTADLKIRNLYESPGTTTVTVPPNRSVGVVAARAGENFSTAQNYRFIYTCDITGTDIATNLHFRRFIFSEDKEKITYYTKQRDTPINFVQG